MIAKQKKLLLRLMQFISFLHPMNKKMKRAYLIPVLIMTMILNGHGQTTDLFDRWIKSTLHIEYLTSDPNIKLQIDSLALLARKKMILEKEFYQKADSLSQMQMSVKGTATAFLVEYHSNFFLITNRHVLYDENEAIYLQKRDTVHSILLYPFDTIREQIFIIPTFREYDKFGYSHIPLDRHIMKIGVRGFESNAYILSDPFTDLAVISLNPDRPIIDSFRKNLLERGYKPINIDSLEFHALPEDIIYTIGFPGRKSLQINFSDIDTTSNYHTRSRFIGNHDISRGCIKNIDKSNGTIYGEISIFPGNSGGPVIDRNGQLIGVIAAVYVKDKVFLPMAKIIHIEKLLSLVKRQYQKDLTFSRAIHRK